MKKLILIFPFMALFFLAAHAQVEKAEIKVEGVCGMCKERIEKAADVKGVKYANWDSETEILSLVFKPSKISLEEIQQNVAAAGHDTEEIKASEEAYDKVHHCCKYREMDNH